MRSLLLAGTLLIATPAVSFADGLHWVVGNRATNSCDIVTTNPTVYGDIWFADGPYKSLDEARLARSTISVCPKDAPRSDVK
jgi:hypothetical protein